MPVNKLKIVYLNLVLAGFKYKFIISKIQNEFKISKLIFKEKKYRHSLISHFLHTCAFPSQFKENMDTRHQLSIYSLLIAQWGLWKNPATTGTGKSPVKIIVNYFKQN